MPIVAEENLIQIVSCLVQADELDTLGLNSGMLELTASVLRSRTDSTEMKEGIIYKQSKTRVLNNNSIILDTAIKLNCETNESCLFCRLRFRNNGTVISRSEPSCLTALPNSKGMSDEQSSMENCTATTTESSLEGCKSQYVLHACMFDTVYLFRKHR